MRISPKRYIQGFCIIVVTLGWAKEIFPSIAECSAIAETKRDATKRDATKHFVTKTKRGATKRGATKTKREATKRGATKHFVTKTKRCATKTVEPFCPHRIYSVANFGRAFPDENDIQLTAAQRYGVKPVQSQADAEKRKTELVYIGSNPYYYVDRLKSSLPYLVPRAAVLLQDIGKTYYDSLQIKGIPLHKIIVTSALRSKDDVSKLQSRNQNATINSCHQYGTTVDICYNRYKTVEDPNGPRKRAVTNDTLKWVLSEVLNDFRKNNRCYIKYEVHQGCFHLTVR